MSDLQSDMTIEIESLVDTSYHPLKIPLRKEHRHDYYYFSIVICHSAAGRQPIIFSVLHVN